MLYYIERKKKEENTAGPKAPQDINDISKKLGGRNIRFKDFPIEKNKVYQKMWLLTVGVKQWIDIYSKVNDSDVIVVQYPIYGFQLLNKFIPLIQKKKGAKFVVVIHDLETLRLGVGSQENAWFIKVEKRLLQLFDKIVCHNNRMREYLVEQGFQKSNLISLEIFDYLTECVWADKNEEGITIAGNLSKDKSMYIYKLLEVNPEFKINLYGPNFSIDELPPNVEYFGSFPPTELPEKIQGKFGLVWDGDSIETCSGNTGNYLRYNNPHKTSLYLASGIPVIIWRGAAMAQFVKENNVGIIVDNILEIKEVLENISEENYAEIKKNVSKIGWKLRKGGYYKDAIENVISQLRSEG